MSQLRSTLVFLSVLLCLILPATSLSAYEAYLKVDGVAGNTVRERWLGHIALHNYDLSMLPAGGTEASQFTARTAAGGTTSVQLLNLLASQKTIERVTLNLVGTDQNGEEYVKFRITLREVKIVSSKMLMETKFATTNELVEEHIFTMSFVSAVWSRGS